MSPSFIKVLVVDDHPAVRAGLQALIGAEPDMRATGEASDEFTLLSAVRRFEPDVVLLDYKLPGTNGIVLCRRLKAQLNAPKVIIYSSFVTASMAVPARIAGADALLDKAVAPRDLSTAIRSVIRGEAAIPQLSPEAMSLAADLMQARDLPILGMLANDVTPREIAETLDISVEELDHRTEGILAVLA